MIKEIGSGVNDSRPKLLKLLTDPTITIIVVEHKDRLTRFGFNIVYECAISNVAAGFVNTAVVSATTPLSTQITSQDSATVTVITPSIGLAKAVGTVVNNNDGTYTVPYSLVVENLGDVALTSVQITDDLASTFSGADGFAVIAGPASSDLTVNSSFSGVSPNTTLLSGTDALTVGQSATVTFTVLVTPGLNLGPYANSAFVEGTTPLSDTVSDTSDNGTNPDPNSA